MSDVDRILSCLPDETKGDAVAFQEATDLVRYCAMCIEGGDGFDWPDSEIMERLAGATQGYGCWLEEVGSAIEAAPLAKNDRALWRVAFNGAMAVVFAYHLGADASD